MSGPILARSEPWMRYGTCVVEQVPTAVFFPTQGVDTTLPKSICARCPVRRDCLELALLTEEEFGIWGGESERARRRMRSARRRQRATA